MIDEHGESSSKLVQKGGRVGEDIGQISTFLGTVRLQSRARFLRFYASASAEAFSANKLTLAEPLDSLHNALLSSDQPSISSQADALQELGSLLQRPLLLVPQPRQQTIMRQTLAQLLPKPI
jgi:hypothetical protein